MLDLPLSQNTPTPSTTNAATTLTTKQQAILSVLNEEQKVAVCIPIRSVLVIAGAGSGKTRVLTYRIAWLCERLGVLPSQIMAVTFTNKAANKLRERVRNFVEDGRGMWIGTFHSICSRMLRKFHEYAKVPENFQVIDSQGQKSLIKRVLTSFNVSDSSFPIAKIQAYINHNKESWTRASHLNIPDFGDTKQYEMLFKIYAEYERACERFCLLDFTELILRMFETLRDNPLVLTNCREQFKVVLVDEFQDTNRLQYVWLKTLAKGRIPVFAVGDDDQLIYGWRGACTDNIEEFRKDFSCNEVLRLERNYRSSSKILQAANMLISHNSARVGKSLWTHKGGGEDIIYYPAYNAHDEADYVVRQVKDWKSEGYEYSDMAVLYRSNSFSRVVEEVFIGSSLPYCIYGGLRFFDRASVKNALAYWRLVHNSKDDVSFERAVSFPPQGIGQKTLAVLRDFTKSYASFSNLSLWEVMERVLGREPGGVFSSTSRATRCLQCFQMRVNDLKMRVLACDSLAFQCQIIIESLVAYYKKLGDATAESNIDNLFELVDAAKEFEGFFLSQQANNCENNISQNFGIADEFIFNSALGGMGEVHTENKSFVRLMTLHASKGLEFPCILIMGVEEGLLPHQRSYSSVEMLEEERRLFYVGITRAQERLALSYAETRGGGGKRSQVHNFSSRFMNELPPKLIRKKDHYSPWRGKVSTLSKQSKGGSLQEAKQETLVSALPSFAVSHPTGPNGKDAIMAGSKVLHRKFGRGLVMERIGCGEASKVRVHFGRFGIKMLSITHANLALVD